MLVVSLEAVLELAEVEVVGVAVLVLMHLAAQGLLVVTMVAAVAEEVAAGVQAAAPTQAACAVAVSRASSSSPIRRLSAETRRSCLDNTDLLKLLVTVAGQASPWSEPFKAQDDVWTKNDYMAIPKERQTMSREQNIDKICSALFGRMSAGQQWAGCVNYIPDDSVGLSSHTYLPKRPSPLDDHEALHGAGMVHPWPGFPKEWK